MMDDDQLEALLAQASSLHDNILPGIFDQKDNSASEYSSPLPEKQFSFTTLESCSEEMVLDKAVTDFVQDKEKQMPQENLNSQDLLVEDSTPKDQPVDVDTDSYQTVKTENDTETAEEEEGGPLRNAQFAFDYNGSPSEKSGDNITNSGTQFADSSDVCQKEVPVDIADEDTKPDLSCDAKLSDGSGGCLNSDEPTFVTPKPVAAFSGRSLREKVSQFKAKSGKKLTLIGINGPAWTKNLTKSLASLWKQQLLCDFTLKTKDGSTVYAHSCVLVSHCGLIHTRLIGEQPRTPVTELTLDSVDHATLMLILQFIYEGQVSIPTTKLYRVQLASKLLQIPSLERVCMALCKKMTMLSATPSRQTIMKLSEPTVVKLNSDGSIVKQAVSVPSEKSDKPCEQKRNEYKTNSGLRNYRNRKSVIIVKKRKEQKVKQGMPNRETGEQKKAKKSKVSTADAEDPVMDVKPENMDPRTLRRILRNKCAKENVKKVSDADDSHTSDVCSNSIGRQAKTELDCEDKQLHEAPRGKGPLKPVVFYRNRNGKFRRPTTKERQMESSFEMPELKEGEWLEATPVENNEFDEFFPCSSCDSFLPNKRKRVKGEHRYAGNKQAPLTYLCYTCGKVLSCKKNLQTHELLHLPNSPVSCNKCDKVFPSSYKLKRHMNRQHEAHDKPLPALLCSHCSKVFYRKGLLRRHEIACSGSRPYKCTVCNQAFSSKTGLTKHMIIHEGTYKYKCDFCFRMFSRSDNLKVHRRTHTGEKPYLCTLCGQSFRHNVTLKGHISTEHQDRSLSELGLQPIEKGKPRQGNYARRKALKDKDDYTVPLISNANEHQLVDSPEVNETPSSQQDMDASGQHSTVQTDSNTAEHDVANPAEI